MTSCLSIIGVTKSTLIGNILMVTHQGAEPGTKSDVYDCLVNRCTLLDAINTGVCVLVTKAILLNY